MEKHHFLRYNAENQKVKPGDGSEQSITSRKYALPKQNNLFWYEKDRVNDAKRYGFTDQNNLFCFCADGMMRFKEAILMNTGGKNTKTKGQNTGTRVLYPRENDITARRQRHSCVLSVASEQSSRDASSLTRLRLVMSLLLMLTLGSGSVWGQTNYSGTYYIASVGYDGNPANTNNFYLCPTNGWCSYKAIDDFEAGDNKPFLTTYRCKTKDYADGENNAVWYVEKHPTLNYYYIKQASTGKYLTSNGTIRTTNNADRMRVHVETIAPEDLDDKELFTIATYSTYLTISPKGVVGGAAGRNWLTVNGGNKNSLKGESGKGNGPTGYTNTAGIIGVYTQDDTNAPFYLEKALSIDAPNITNNNNGTFTITTASGATIYYTTDGSTPTTTSYTGTGTTSVNLAQTESLTVIKAIAKATSDPFPTNVTTYYLPVCERPVISVSGSTVTITCTTEGATIHYTTDGSPATSASTVYTGPFAKGDASTFRAIATKTGYVTSSEAILLPPTEVSSSSQITNMNGSYILASNFTSSGSIGTADNPFKGIINGNLNTLTLGYPLVAYADGATIKNVILNNVNISSSNDNDNGNAGAICCEATGDTRIYNCGVLSGSVGGSEKVGGIVGLLDGRARVINCYNYADITSGSNCGGIVGYNNVASTSGNLQTMVMNCMFYGNITGGNAAPIYGGEIIHNKYASADDTGLNNYCYFLYDEEKNPYVKSIATGNYHGALGAEERFLNRFEFFRMTLNSTRNLAAYYVTGDATQKGEMAKWVLDKSIAPYPILKVQGKYPSVVNPDAAHATTQTDRNKGGLLGTLSVSISGTGSGDVFSAPEGASITTTGSLTLNITDKDEDNFNYNYKKVQLPYYNEVGTGNYTKASATDETGRVVTGWKIVEINNSPTGTGTFVNSGTDAPAFNFVDRTCTNKDLYSVSGRVFAQGAYWEVPDGVTSITIEPYWAKAVYLTDANYDVTYSIKSGSTATTNKYGVTVCGSCPMDCNGQTVCTNLSTALTNLASDADHTVYDYAVVLVGNYHQAANGALVNNGTPVTFMSADLDGDNEPDNTLFYFHNQRRSVSPIRFDFLNIPGIGMVKRTYDATMDPEPGIFCPTGWFEITNSVFIRFGQFEYAGSKASSNSFLKTTLAPLILQGGIYEQFVSSCRTDAQNTNYLLIGGNAWFLNFANGCHTAQANKTPKVPINVTGGDYTNFYLTGIYQPATNEDAGNAECYIDGGRFTEVAGTGMQQLKGDVTWLINAADITSFYGGGINAAKPITGSISTTISNSHVDEFYGGPKFGDMSNNKTVTTDATNCHFGKFFGAGYGGTAFNKVLPSNNYDSSSESNTRSWNSWVTAEYKRAYSSGNGGISTNYDYEFMLHSDGNQTVARFYVNYASLSLASTRNVTSTLSGCTIGTFYGGGSLGAVNGDVNSTLTNCTVTGNVFGAGFSASVPTVEVWNSGAYLTPNPTYNRTANVFNNASVKTPKDNNQYVVYTWSKTHGNNANPLIDTEDGKHYIHTDVSLDGLGAVSGNVTLTLNGATTVGESVYGGGEESGVGGNTTVVVESGTIGVQGEGGAEYGNVYGGGKGKADDKLAGLVKGNTNVTISQTEDRTTKIYHNIYGGGAYGSVGEFDYADESYHTAHPEVAVGMPKGRKDGATGGNCTVTITGGTIGTNGRENGMVFGSSRGDVSAPVGDVNPIDPNDYLAWVYDTHVIIGTSGSDDGPQINGSVYGSGENGHTFHKAQVDVHSGTIGIEDKNNVVTNNGKRYEGAQYPYRGNVYGGGCGTDTYQDESPDPKDPSKTKTFTYYNFLAGIVRGNTTVNIDGGHIIHNVYGGGAMGSVGTYSFNAENMPTSCATGTGLCTVTISGGDIGTDDMKMTAAERPDDFGHVFGAGRGDVHDSIDYPNVQKTAYYNNTKLTIKGTAFVRGSVYGGSESGHVLNDTHVVIGGTTSSDDPQIGNGDGVNRRYTTTEWEEGKPDVLKATNHWTYIDNGAPYDQFADENGYYTTEYAEGGRQVATDGHTFYGNVFGGGSGYYPYTQGKWLFSAGSVGGKTKVEILSGHILNNVYGGCEMSDVTGSATIEMKGGTVGVPRTNAQINLNPSFGHIFGAGMGDKRIFFNTVTNVASTDVKVSGGRVYGSVHGGGEDGHILGDAKTTISGDVVIGSNEKTELQAIFGFDGNVFGGGQGSPTALTAGTVGGNVELNIMGGTMLGSVYGGGRIASVGTFFRKATDENYGKMQEGDDHGLITVNLTGGTIKQNVYGGGMGIKRGFSAEGVDKELFAISKTVTVNLNLENKVADNAVGCVVKGNIFGCNNVNSSPQETVTVNVGGTQREGASQIAYTASATDAKVKGGNDVTKYDVKGVYGGGNMAAYKPNGGKETTYSTHVNISGCYRTSIGQVYGGGNAASTPATNVTVDGAYEIYELFGGGNGKDQVSYDGTNKEDNPGANVGFYQYDDNITDETATTEKPASDTPEKRSNNYGYGSGEATVNIFGGLLHCVFGGSNTKGNVCKTALTLLEEGTSCAFCVDEVYGGGKSAPMDAEAKLLMQCIPGLKAAYGGAEAADIQGGVTLNITNGTFDQVFGGNNLSGTIRGPIVVNIEETGCKPIIIGELYGGGNQAGYSVYGYDVDNTGNTILKESGSSRWEDPQVNVKSFTSIGNIYGGGLGEDAVMVGDPKVNINVAVGDNASAAIDENATTETIRTGNANAQGGYPVPKHDSGKIGAINNVFGGGNAAKVIGNTQVKIGTESTIDYVTKATGETNPRTGITVEGVDIRGNVYGGGNNAEVTGNTEVIIGKKQE